MPIPLAKFLGEKKKEYMKDKPCNFCMIECDILKPCKEYKKWNNTKPLSKNERDVYNSFHTEAGKIMLGLSDTKLREVLKGLDNKPFSRFYRKWSAEHINELADALIAKESELIVKKEG